MHVTHYIVMLEGAVIEGNLMWIEIGVAIIAFELALLLFPRLLENRK